MYSLWEPHGGLGWAGLVWAGSREVWAGGGGLGRSQQGWVGPGEVWAGLEEPQGGLGRGVCHSVLTQHRPEG